MSVKCNTMRQSLVRRGKLVHADILDLRNDTVGFKDPAVELMMLQKQPCYLSVPLQSSVEMKLGLDCAPAGQHQTSFIIFGLECRQTKDVHVTYQYKARFVLC